MKITAQKIVFNSQKVENGSNIILNSRFDKSPGKVKEFPDHYIYPPFINSHDHLIGNWFPRAGGKKYANSDLWVEDMKTSDSYLERNKVWVNDGKFELTKGNAKLLTGLGIYKNIFSGCNAIQDHGPQQTKEYYDSFPIDVIRKYRQCHSITMGNWWGGRSAIEEWKSSKGEMPFIIHAAEGFDEQAKSDFSKLYKSGLIKPNTMLIHSIAFADSEIKTCAENGTSICVCPGSNLFLIGKTIDVEKCLKYKVNLVIGTDSTMSGDRNLLFEIKTVRKLFPNIEAKKIYQMITENARKALFLSNTYGKLNSETSELLLIKKKHDDVFENLFRIDCCDIDLFIHRGIPIYGNAEFLDFFRINSADYFFYSNRENEEKFVIGHPEKTVSQIENILGYSKQFHYLPFQF